MRVEPDLEFIKYLKSAGGDSLKKCFQCATCSVVCPLSTDDSPFPRKEMIWSQWGLKDKLIADTDVLLCHQCGDCTAYCPRGAKPGDVLGAVRAYMYTHYGFPQGLAKLASSGKNTPLLIGIPAVIILIMWIISGGMHIPSSEEFAHNGFGHFFGHWDFHWLTKNVAFIDAIMLPTAGLAVFAAYKGVTSLWKAMSLQYGINVEFRPSAKQFIAEFVMPSINEIVAHSRFHKCGVNLNRAKGHLPLLLSFVGLLIVTGYSAFTQDVLGAFIPSLHGPISQLNPIKWLANISAVALIFGIATLWANRSSQEAEEGKSRNFYDWFLIYEIMAVGVTGLAAEIFRLVNLPLIAYPIYYFHLVAVMMLFLYMPYTKFAHLVYRTTAMAFERYRDSDYVTTKVSE
ncbi:MAG: quinone-interacting membrane-bound oxidoreductase complex subunit QmoC [Thermodesulfobacteriota bacterium]|nr:quinone-interacting membrane-bound oxidoreductase complex subunit QmoC [Thermodesulfobacteriota bacterium]